ncbi:MAG: hypothetical protein GC154_02500 [bacterium]|nr:hypothetical protein [bacterium]
MKRFVFSVLVGFLLTTFLPPSQGQSIDLAAPPAKTVEILSGFTVDNTPLMGYYFKNVGNAAQSGIDDFTISLPFNDDDLLFKDSIYLIQGEFILDNATFVKIVAGVNELPSRVLKIHGYDDTRFGSSVERAGDFDRDGINEIAVLAPLDGEGGKIYVIRVGLLPPNPALIDFGLPGDYEEYTLLTIEGTVEKPVREPMQPCGDIDGDGYSDILIAAPPFTFSSDGSEILGYVIYGGEDLSRQTIKMGELDSEQTLTVLMPDGDNPNIVSKRIFRNAGDVTGDGVNDLLISLGYRSVEPYASEMLVVPGGVRRTGMMKTTDLAQSGVKIRLTFFSGEQDSELSSIATGDADGDSISDIALGYGSASLIDSATPTGVIALVHGGFTVPSTLELDGSVDEPLTILGHSQPGARFGASMAARNGRLLAGAPGVTGALFTREQSGAVYEYYPDQLKKGLVSDTAGPLARRVIVGAFTDQQIGSSVAYFVGRNGMQYILTDALGNSAKPDRLGYLIPNTSNTDIGDWSLY